MVFSIINWNIFYLKRPNTFNTSNIDTIDLARNNAFARRYISVYVDNVVGAKGVHLQVRSRDPNGALDSFANNLIETRWKAWGVKCTSDEKLGWIDCQRLFAETFGFFNSY